MNSLSHPQTRTVLLYWDTELGGSTYLLTRPAAPARAGGRRARAPLHCNCSNSRRAPDARSSFADARPVPPHPCRAHLWRMRASHRPSQSHTPHVLPHGTPPQPDNDGPPRRLGASTGCASLRSCVLVLECPLSWLPDGGRLWLRAGALSAPLSSHRLPARCGRHVRRRQPAGPRPQRSLLPPARLAQ